MLPSDIPFSISYSSRGIPLSLNNIILSTFFDKTFVDERNNSFNRLRESDLMV